MEDIQRIIDGINVIYEQLRSLNNDQLREKLWDIQYRLASEYNVVGCHNSLVTEVYAIVKETLRRLCLGPLVVTANANDVSFSEIQDSIRIEGKYAIYANHWSVGGVDFQWDMIPYDEQLMCGLYLNDGYAAEMATGEGKTLSALFAALYNGLTHRGVHLMTSNRYLSTRDYELTGPIYMFLGLSVDCISKGNDMTVIQDAYMKDVTFGATSDFIFNYLRDHIVLDKGLRLQVRDFNVAIIDELDSTLIDQAQIPHILSCGRGLSHKEMYGRFKEVVEKMVSDKDLFRVTTLDHVAEFTDRGKTWLREYFKDENLFKYQTLHELDSEAELDDERRLEMTKRINQQHALSNLLIAYVTYQKDIDYIVKDNQVILLDRYTGRLLLRSRLEHGLHSAIEAKENVPIENELDGMAVISIKNYFKLYPKMCGMSGTITSVETELKEVYGMKSISVPTHRPNIRKDHPLRIYLDRNEKLQELVSFVNQIHVEGRPVLVCCESEKENMEFCTILQDNHIPHKQLNVLSEDDESRIIADSGNVGNITVSTRMAGRGTDIKLSEESRTKGGLFVIGTTVFPSIRTDLQLMGRSGRQGEPGDTVFFASLDDDILSLLGDDEREFVLNCKIGKVIPYGRCHDLFIKAQRKSDELDKCARRQTGLKDDIVDTFRRGFYEEREKILAIPGMAVTKCREFLSESSYEEHDVQDHLDALYGKLVPILAAMSRNESSNMRVKHDFTFHDDVFKATDDVLIPFSENEHLSLLYFSRNNILHSKDIFINEFVRQSMLLVYDKYWTEFVKHVLDRLDVSEIDKLPIEYKEVYNKIRKHVPRIIMETIIPLGTPSREQQMLDFIDVPVDMSISHPDPDTPCPCGSGKKYCECHGRDIRNRKIRRR